MDGKANGQLIFHVFFCVLWYFLCLRASLTHGLSISAFPRAATAGIIEVGNDVEIVGIRDKQKSTCTGVEMFKKSLDRGQVLSP